MSGLFYGPVKMYYTFLRSIQYNRITVSILRELRFVMMYRQRIIQFKLRALQQKSIRLLVIVRELGLSCNKTETIIKSANFEEFQNAMIYNLDGKVALLLLAEWICLIFRT